MSTVRALLAKAWSRMNITLGILDSEWKGESWAGPAHPTEESRREHILHSFREVFTYLEELRQRMETGRPVEELLKEKRFRIKALGTEIKALKKEIESRDREIREQNNKIDEQRRTIEGLPGGWMTASLDEDDIPELPLPRFEVRWYKYYRDQDPEDWSVYRVVYQLVYQHLFDHIVTVPFSWTTVHGHERNTKPWDPVTRYHGDEEAHPVQSCELPSRDGASMFHDAAHFKLPIYIVPPVGEPRRLDNTDMIWYHQHHVLKGRKHRREAAE